MNTSTCIVAIADGTTGLIAADSAGIDGSLKRRTVRIPKVFRKGPMIIGYTSFFRMGQILQYQLTVPERTVEQDADAFMCGPFAEAVRECLKSHGYSTISDNVHSGGTFLIVYAGHVYRLQDDFAVIAPEEQFDACGCGRDFALGYLYSCIYSQNGQLIGRPLDDDDAVSAVRAAAHFNAGVAGPVAVLTSNGQEAAIIR